MYIYICVCVFKYMCVYIVVLWVGGWVGRWVGHLNILCVWVYIYTHIIHTHIYTHRLLPHDGPLPAHDVAQRLHLGAEGAVGVGGDGCVGVRVVGVVGIKRSIGCGGDGCMLLCGCAGGWGGMMYV